MAPRSTLRLSGSSGTYRALLPRLPKNLVVIDGHCLWCQSRMQYVLERNFSFFHFRSVLYEDPKAAALRLRQHALHFASLDSSEGRELQHRFFTSAPKKASFSSSSTPSSSTRLPLPEDLAILFIEKKPARHWFFLRQQGARPSHENHDNLIFYTKDASMQKRNEKKKRSESTQRTPQVGGIPFPSASSANVSSVSKEEEIFFSENDPNQVDLILSINFSALCRIGMHLDRFLPRLLSRFLYYCVPEWLGSIWFRHFVSKRRQFIWGSSEEDAVDVLGRVDGMKERRWAWRRTYKR